MPQIEMTAEEVRMLLPLIKNAMKGASALSPIYGRLFTKLHSVEAALTAREGEKYIVPEGRTAHDKCGVCGWRHDPIAACKL